MAECVVRARAPRQPWSGAALRRVRRRAGWGARERGAGARSRG
jgi:hypothetical protein